MVLTYELKTSKDYDKFIEDLGTTDGNYTVEKYKKEKKVVETASFYLPSADEKGNTFNDDYMKMLEEMGYTCALDE